MASRASPIDKRSADTLRRGQLDPAEWRRVRQALENDSPRSAALLGAAHLDMHLQHEIQSEFRALPQEDYENLFRPTGGPLSSTEAKINLAFCMGMFGDVTKADLKRICKIRNLFAHSPHAISFETEAIKNWCSELRALRAYREAGLNAAPYSDVDSNRPRDLYVASCIEIPIALFFERKMSTGEDGIRTTNLVLNLWTPKLP